MKKSILFLLILAVLFSSHASAIWYFDSQYVTVDLTISSGLDIGRGSGSNLEYVTANVSFVPRDSDVMKVQSIKATPTPKEAGDIYVFRWDQNIPDNPSYEISSRVRIKNDFKSIKKIDFPYIGFSDEVQAYTLPGEKIDSNDSKVILKASELAEGQTDYYATVWKIAEWTRENVDYDLSTLNSKATFKASWVLAKKDGVCDEITTLFIALLRAVGIPARFVSGIAYTDSPKFPQKWGPHGWAEVYFPGVGWVPFDVTYGEFGFVDPTHIKLKASFDSGDPDTRYEWLGRNIEVSAAPIVVSAELVKSEGSVGDPLSIKSSPVQNEVGIGSYNVVDISVTNNIDSYVSTLLFLAKMQGGELEADHEPISIMLKPRETKSFYWLVKVVDSLDTGFTYTFPITAADSRNTSGNGEFYVVPQATVFSRDEMQRVIDAAKKEDEKVYSKRIGVNCSADKSSYYTYELPKVECVARNAGNVILKDLNFCFGQQCTRADLGISQVKSFGYVLEGAKPGVNKVEFSIDGKDVSKSFFYDIDVMDPPKIVIDDLEYPAGIEFDRNYSVVFRLQKSSSSYPYNVTFALDAAGSMIKDGPFQMDGDRVQRFNLNSGDLSMKPNKFVISVTYQDLNGKTYTEREDFVINLVNVTFGQRVVIWLQDADRWLRNLFK